MNFKFGVMTLCYGDAYRESVRPCLDSQREYDEQHGHDSLWINHKGKRPRSWTKIERLIELLSGDLFDIVFVRDSDVMIMNPSIDIEQLAKKYMELPQSIVTSHDQNGPMAGNFFARSDSLRTLREWWSMTEFTDHRLAENAALYQLFIRDTSPFHIEAPRTFNSYPPQHWRDPRFKYHPGDWCIHFAGCRASGLRRQIQRAEGMRQKLRCVKLGQ